MPNNVFAVFTRSFLSKCYYSKIISHFIFNAIHIYFLSGSVSDWEKKAFWTLLALVLFLFVIVVVVVVVKKFLQRHEKATPQAKGNAVIDFVDGNWEEKKVFYKVGNKWHDDGHVEGNMLNSNYMTTTSC